MEEHVKTPNRKNKRWAVIRLWRGIEHFSGEQVLCFAVLERTILDIGIKGSNNSDEWFENNDWLDGIMDGSGVNRSYLFRILRECSVWP